MSDRIGVHIAVEVGEGPELLGGLNCVRVLALLLLEHTRISISEQLLRRNVKRCRGGLVFKAHRRVYHLTLG